MPLFDTALPGPPWSVLILPFIEESALYATFNISAGSFVGFNNREQQDSLAGTGYTDQWTSQNVRNKAFECPSNPNNTATTHGTDYLGVMGGGPASTVNASSTSSSAQWNTQVANTYSCACPTRTFANNGVLFANSKTLITQITDGSSNTMLLAETKYFQTNAVGTAGYPGTWASGIHPNLSNTSTAGNAVTLTNTYSYILQGAMPQTAGCGVTMTAVVNGLNTVKMPNPTTGLGFCTSSSTQGSYHAAGGANFAMCDGSVVFLLNETSLSVLQSLAIRNDGNTVSFP
jgi:prepilin-type processing-associated H-X9-DG protein